MAKAFGYKKATGFHYRMFEDDDWQPMRDSEWKELALKSKYRDERLMQKLQLQAVEGRGLASPERIEIGASLASE